MLGANGIVGGGRRWWSAPPDRETLNTGTTSGVLFRRRRVQPGHYLRALNMAVVLKLPAVFVFENNQYGEGTGVGYAVGSHDIAGRAAGFGLPSR
jgi:pyruvate dehydrogenase E1 component alpha subunit